MFFLNVCENPDILRILYFGLKILDYIFLLIPIGLIIFVIIDVVKIVIAGDEKEAKGNQKTIINRVIFAVLLFFVPTIVAAIMNVLAESGIKSNYAKCIENANKTSIQQYQIIKDAQKPKTPIKQSNTGSIYENLATRMVQLAEKQVGYKAGSNQNNKYGKELKANNMDWCGIFMTWLAKNTTYNNTNLFKDVLNKNNKFNIEVQRCASPGVRFFYNTKGFNFYYSKHHGGNYTPKKGDYIYFDWNADWNGKISQQGLSDHVGLVVEVKNGKVITIEGNTDGGNGQVKKKEYPLNSKYIVGYGSWYQK